MNKPHVFKHNGVWLIKEVVDPEIQEYWCGGCIGQFDKSKCKSLPDCSEPADNYYGCVNYIFKEFQNNYKKL